MAEKITPRDQDFPQWYQDLVLQAKLADYSPVKGCMVIRPNGYGIWENIQRELDIRIKRTGARNAYFPLFIPESYLKKEAKHIEGFAPQCAVVTYAGAKVLEEKLVVRPTSETIINSMFSKWIQSYRDLPMMVNQWANVVRWEMRTRLFLRTTEFLWQEGHTCHATAEEAENEARQMLEVYKTFASEVLAIPVLAGLKTDSERFAGALRTYAIEAMMQDKKALQAGTSHNLSTHFAHAFNTQFLDKDGKQKLVHQTSWGVSTRLIGAVIMCHSDDLGLILPPRLASTHLVIVPITPQGQSKDKIVELAKELSCKTAGEAIQRKLPYDFHVQIDQDNTKQLGWKLHEYDLLGIPVRIEIGPKDLAQGAAVVKRRDRPEKERVAFENIPDSVVNMLVAMQSDLLETAKKRRDQNSHQVETFEELSRKISSTGGFYQCSWCRSPKCEEKLKEELKATIRVLSMDTNFNLIPEKSPCVICGGGDGNVQAIFAKNY